MGFQIKTSMFFIKVIVYGLMPLIPGEVLQGRSRGQYQTKHQSYILYYRLSDVLLDLEPEFLTIQLLQLGFVNRNT